MIALTRLIDDVVYAIFDFGDRLDLVSCSETCVNWNRIIKRSEKLWQKHINYKWANDKTKIEHTLSLSLLSQIKLIPLSIWKPELNAVDCAYCSEKAEFQKLLVARLIFAGKINSAVRSTARKVVMLPPWCSDIGEWKVCIVQ